MYRSYPTNSITVQNTHSQLKNLISTALSLNDAAGLH